MSDIPPPTPTTMNPNPTTATSCDPKPTTGTDSTPNPFENNPNMRVLICRQCSTSIAVYETAAVKFGMGIYTLRVGENQYRLAFHTYIILDEANVRLGTALIQNTCREVFCRYCNNTILGWQLVETGMYMIDATLTLLVSWRGNQLHAREVRTPTPNPNRPTTSQGPG